MNGVSQEIDIKSRILASASDTSAVTYIEAANAMTKELGNIFDESVTVSQSSGVFTITDAQGRSLSIEQGNGSGYFGSDYQNSGSLDVEANVPNGLFVEWDNDDLVIKHTKGGEVDITNFSSSALGTATFDVADTASSALKEPITFQDTADSTYASVSGVIGSAIKLLLILAIPLAMSEDSAGTAADTVLFAQYGFKITDGDGHHYINFSADDSRYPKIK